MKKKIFVILGNQLFNLSFFQKFKKDHIFFLSEDLGLCTYEKHHKQKILLFLSAMRSFRDELEKNGFEVIYKKIEDDDFEEKSVDRKPQAKTSKHTVCEYLDIFSDDEDEPNTKDDMIKIISCLKGSPRTQNKMPEPVLWAEADRKEKW